ncbi:putative Swr1p complex component (Swc5) [Aspergillus clavatus NRRL 1]|uniref:SWR1-complex protein 5 n=1 Tax=Aspergillus clavatus (strain ATCC 1007 / CBS 513.65 / DSM 816 / NCTC 3887 / NRRL 1 / QM 1276 / 107) TaxID=344612 RepID=A1CNG8_ASPCL|nr:Swr1p complex component (Swc5), putative [Aspergillus clavatus NRRL 1]EAW07189.1 Swr1p complex component (Swc5), putative [Aspergillus clavatus NRRL 1]
MATDPTAAAAELDFNNEQYDSAEDEDFQLDAEQEDAELTGSDSEDEATEPAAKRLKTGVKETENDDKALDSGDEAMIQKAKAKQQNKQKQKKGKGNASDDDDEDEDDVDFDDDEEGGPGGFVRTRAMRMKMQEERKPLAKIDGATVDVDALWARMNAHDSGSAPLPLQTEQQDTVPSREDKDGQTTDKQALSQSKPPYTEEMVKIKRTYKFAGEMITEEKIVPKDSAEAKLFLANGESAESVTDADVEDAANVKDALKLRRPLRKISRFDPNPTGTIKKSWDKQASADITGQAEGLRGPKINTVEKSRLDWAAYVDEAGIKDELKVHSKAKEGFIGRMDFLDRVGAKREEERRNARLKGL